MNKGEEILNEINNNTEMGLLQGQKMIDSVDNLEPIMEGVLVKTDELLNEQKKTNELLVNKEESKQIVADEMTVTLKGLRGEPGKTPTAEELLSIIKPLIPEPVKGDEGYTPKKGVDYFDGDDYLLTEEDKNEIASKIDVPIVEKIIEKTIVEKPFTIDKTKIVEVAKYETGEEIKSKLEKLKTGLNYDSLYNKPNIEEYIQRIKTSSRDYNLTELKDVLITSPTNAQVLKYNSSTDKWENGTGGGGGGVSTASNGLTLNGADVKLGGNLTEDTTITGGIYSFTATGENVGLLGANSASVAAPTAAISGSTELRVRTPDVNNASSASGRYLKLLDPIIGSVEFDDLTAAFAAKEDVANKSTNTALGTSDTLYPTQNAVKTYVDNEVKEGNPATKLFNNYNFI